MRRFPLFLPLRQQISQLPPGLRTRFAPSPTGYLHLGHVASAIFVWGVAGARGGRVLLRIEDHDRQRCRPAFAEALLEDLAWLGLIDGGGEISVQSAHPERYEGALVTLRSRAEVYFCDCSRKAISERQGAGSYSELCYDGFCRHRQLAAEAAGIRLHLPIETLAFHDLMQGDQVQIPAEQCGDLLLRERAGSWTYHYCVTVDDAAEDIDLIIRGTDLLDACGRQRQLAQLLGQPSPRYLLHHPLIVDEEGQKLSKRYGSTAMRSLREAGYSAADVLGLAAHAVGLLSSAQPIAAKDLGGLFL